MCFLLDYYDNMILLLFINAYKLNEVSQLFKLFKSIFDNSGMELIAVNQAYNSIIFWVK
jgi:hypothetical protein